MLKNSPHKLSLFGGCEKWDLEWCGNITLLMIYFALKGQCKIKNPITSDRSDHSIRIYLVINDVMYKLVEASTLGSLRYNLCLDCSLILRFLVLVVLIVSPKSNTCTILFKCVVLNPFTIRSHNCL